MSQYLLFEVKDKKYCIDIKHILEIKRKVFFSKLITNDDLIIGVHNLRNKIVTILDTNILINDEQGNRTCDFIIILKSENENGKFALEVSYIRDILSSSDLKEVDIPYDDTDNNHVVRKVLKKGEELIQVIDYEQLIKKIFNKEK